MYARSITERRRNRFGNLDSGIGKRKVCQHFIVAALYRFRRIEEPHARFFEDSSQIFIFIEIYRKIKTAAHFRPSVEADRSVYLARSTDLGLYSYPFEFLRDAAALTIKLFAVGIGVHND